LRRAERRQWWLSFSSVLVTLILTLGIVSLSFTIFVPARELGDVFNIHFGMHALVGMLIIFLCPSSTSNCRFIAFV
jgi:hypothetical protein